MRPHHLSAFIILLAWQTAPLPHAVTDEVGSVRWTFSAMAGAGTWEDASFDCSGNLIGAEAARYQDIGAKVEMLDPRSHLHVSLAGGSTRRSATSGSYPSATGAFGGMQVAWEGRRAGVGGGLVTSPGEATRPNIYLRIGDGSHGHFRMEVMPLTETHAMAGVFRVGVGFAKGFAGFTYGPFFETTKQTTAFADLALPLSRSLDVRLGVNAGPGEEVFQWGLAAGLRLRR